MLTRGQIADLVEANWQAYVNGKTQESVALLQWIFGGPCQVYTPTIGVNDIQWSVLYGPGKVVILCGGVRNQGMFAETLAAWGNRDEIIRQGGFNAKAGEQAEKLLAALPAEVGLEGSEIYLVGHSLGGMVVLRVAVLVEERVSTTPAFVLTTGAPRAASPALGGDYSQGEQVRLMNAEDPICFMPARFGESPGPFLAAVGLSVPVAAAGFLATATSPDVYDVSAIWPSFMHGPSGICLLGNGYSLAMNTPVTNPLGREYLTAAAIVASGILSATDHDIATYVRNVRYWADVESNQKTLEDSQAAPNPEGEDVSWGADPSALLRDTMPQGLQGFYLVPVYGVTSMANAAQATAGSMPLENGKTGGCIYLRGSMVACYPTVGRARTAARRMNKFLLQLSKAEEVSVSGMTEGITSYLFEAALGGGIDRRPVHVVS